MTVVIYTFLIPACGIGMLAYFRYCDPVKAGIIDKYDSMMPYFVAELFKDTPGMVGIFISAAYSWGARREHFYFQTIFAGYNEIILLKSFGIKRIFL